jgi:hypothetical protein
VAIAAYVVILGILFMPPSNEFFRREA